MPLRLVQEQLLQKAEHNVLNVNDEFFAKRELSFNTFKWGTGRKKVLITHGWGSKAADFCDMITALLALDDIQVVAFDAPGNGSSEGELSNLLLFKNAVQAMILKYGMPDIVIGHSLGGMANVIALAELQTMPTLLISLAPLMKLKENFEASMNLLNVTEVDQKLFFDDFKRTFGVDASYFRLEDWYKFGPGLKHYLLFDPADQISPHSFLEEFLSSHKSVIAKSYAGVGHDKILKSPELIGDLVEIVRSLS